MRKIEQEMLNAIKARKTWTGADTQVIKGDNDTLSIRLHGNTIAWVLKDGSIKVSKPVLYHWPTRTTCSRLRALGVNVSIRNGAPYLDGQRLSITNIGD